MPPAELTQTQADGRRWALRWSDLTGRPTPRVERCDVSTWKGPHAFPMYGREGWFFIGFWVFGWLARRSDVTLGAWVNDTAILGPAVAVAVVYSALWLTTGGWVTVDPVSERLLWRRPFGREPAAVWRFDEFRGISARSGFYSATVRIDTGDRLVKFRVPDGEAAALADSVRRIAGLPER